MTPEILYEQVGKIFPWVEDGHPVHLYTHNKQVKVLKGPVSSWPPELQKAYKNPTNDGPRIKAIVKPWPSYKSNDGLSLVEKFVKNLDEFVSTNDVSWVDIGGKSGNAGVINQVTDPMRALAERLTNAFDARVERARSEKGFSSVDTFSLAVRNWLSEAPSLVDGDEGRIRKEAKNVRVSVFRPDSTTQGTDFLVDIRDTGIGIAPNEVHKTILSLNESTKNGCPYVVGAFGQGGSTTFKFCPYALIVTRKVGTNLVSITVVRQHLDEERDIPVYQYLSVGERGEVPYFVLDPSKDDEFPPGTLVRHIGYDLSKNLAKLRGRSVYGALNHYLFSTLLPCYVEQYGLPSCTTFTTSVERSGNRVIYGSRNRLMRAHSYSHKHNQESEHTKIAWYDHVTENLGIMKILDVTQDVGSVSVEYWVVDTADETKERKGGKKKNEKKSEEFVKNTHPILFTVNGICHGEMTRAFITGDLSFPSLENKLIIHVNCDRLTRAGRNQLISSTREHLVEGDIFEEIKRRVKSFLSNDPNLRRLNDEFFARSISGSAASRVRTRFVQDALSRWGLTALGRNGIRRKKKIDGDIGPFTPALIQEHEPPTMLEWSLGAKVLEFRPGGQRIFQFETDASSSYWDPDDQKASRIKIHISGDSIRYAGGGTLQTGRARVRFECLKDATIGATGEISLTLKVGNKLLKSSVQTLVVESKEKNPRTGDVDHPTERVPKIIRYSLSKPGDSAWTELGLPEDLDQASFNWRFSEKDFTITVGWTPLFQPYAEYKEDLKSPFLKEAFENTFLDLLTLYASSDVACNVNNRPTITYSSILTQEDNGSGETSFISRRFNTLYGVAQACAYEAYSQIQAQLKRGEFKEVAESDEAAE